MKAEKQALKKQEALNLAPTLYHYKWIAAGIGISEKTFIEWRKADEDFESQLNQKRAEFIKTNMRKARPDFLLETADRETFGKQVKVEASVNPIDVLLSEFGIKRDGKLSEGEEDDRQSDEPIQSSSQS